MPTQPGVFVLQSDRSIVPMQPAAFAAEEQFQDLIARFPVLLVGDQVDPEDPRRWVLVKREQAVGLDEAGGARWSIDHVFLDQDAIPTLVEIKRGTDTRIRREVVGQMLDYAANCGTFWTPGTLRSSFEQTCAAGGRSSEEVLAELLGPGGDPDSFWPLVDRNLADGRIRLLFVADVVPVELRRIVEFLNRQMDPAEVLAVELRQFEGQGLRTIVPTVLGQTETDRSKHSVSRPAQGWTEQTFFEKIDRERSENESHCARLILEAMRTVGDKISFGNGRVDGSVLPILNAQGEELKPLSFFTNGRLELYFGSLKSKPIFDDVDVRRRWLAFFNAIDGVRLNDYHLDRYPAIHLSQIAADPEGSVKVKRALEWFRRVAKREISPADDLGPDPSGPGPAPHSAAGT